MKILFLHEGSIDATEYKNKLTAWGIDIVLQKIDLSNAWKDGVVSKEWLAKLLATIYDQNAETIDVVQFLYSKKSWKGKFGLLGVHYHKTYSGYQHNHIHHRKGWEKTALHELMHTFDDIVRIYLNKSLASFLAIWDWDEGVVHGKGVGFREYQYDEPYADIKHVLDDAILVRKKLAHVALLQRLLIKIRDMQSPKPVEEIHEEPDNKLYKAAVACLGLDASPKDRVDDEVACVESVVTIIRTLISTFPFVTGTWSLFDILNTRVDCKEVTEAQPGDLVLYVTGKGNGKVKNGHVFIVGMNGELMSNDSRDGIWKQNYTLASADTFYRGKGGMKGYIFRLAV